jgi:hypothetical protein
MIARWFVAQREPMIPQPENGRESTRTQRDELRRLLDELDDRPGPLTAIEREQLVRTARRAFADIPTSSYEFIRRKHRELDQEDGRRGEESGPS